MHLNPWSLKCGLGILRKWPLSWDLWHFLIPRRPELPQEESFSQFFGLPIFPLAKTNEHGNAQNAPKERFTFLSWSFWRSCLSLPLNLKGSWCAFQTSPPPLNWVSPTFYHQFICSHTLNSMTERIGYNLKLEVWFLLCLNDWYLCCIYLLALFNCW